MARRKYSRRANSSGSIVKLSGRRRRPYAVRVTTGTDIDGNPIRKYLGYFEKRDEAVDFLNMYNLMKRKNISERNLKSIDDELYEEVSDAIQRTIDVPTFKDIFDILYEEKYQYNANCKSQKSWFNKLTPLHGRKINDISLFDMQAVFDEVKKNRGSGTIMHMKGIVTDIFEYAVIHEYISRDKDFSSYIDVSFKNGEKGSRRAHTPFTVDEIKRLIYDDSLEARLCLIYIFTGCRPVELLTIKTENIFIDTESDDDGQSKKISYMICGSKTESGRNRVVPIHDQVKPYIIQLLNEHQDYLILPESDARLSCYRWRYFDPLMKRMDMNHTSYDTRHTFSTLAELYRLDAFSVKRIMGHKANDITKDVYTHSINNRLFDEINKIRID